MMPRRLLTLHRTLRDLRDWLVLAWVLWWSWAYFQGALAQRFPQLLWWIRR
jgi:hypothetical protein